MENNINLNETTPKRSFKESPIYLVWRKLYLENRKQILMGLGTILGFWFMIGFFSGYGGSSSGEGLWWSYLPFAYIGCGALVAFSFNDMKRKEGRLSILMTPASTWDKFLPRMLNSIIGSMLVFIAGYVLEELGRMFGFVVTYGMHTSFTLPGFGYSIGTDAMVWALAATLFTTLMGCYFYGSILWPRNSFLKTSALLIMLQIFLGMLISFFTISILRGGYMVKWLVDGRQFGWITAAFFLAVTVGLYWLSYIRFKNSTILYRIKQ